MCDTKQNYDAAVLLSSFVSISVSLSVIRRCALDFLSRQTSANCWLTVLGGEDVKIQ